jgi:radical SAM protein with 4Fe4S-binding SPASM domain
VCWECNQNLQITKNISIRIKEILENLWLSLNSLPQGFSQSQNVEFYWCPWWTFSGCIDVAWNVYACLYMRNKENILGNVYSQSILDIWKQNNEYIIQGKKEQCLDCDFLHRCWGKCLVKNK